MDNYLLDNIFLFKSKNFHDLDQLDIYSYPDDLFNKDSKDQIMKILYGHDQGYIIQQNRNREEFPNNLRLNNKNSNPFIIETPVPQVINDLNIYTTCINGKIIIGLIFDKDDNPYDYKDLFEELLNELLNIEKTCSFEDEIEIDNLLLTIFIDIRRYGDEYIEKKPVIKFHYQESFIKVFIFGIDYVGKTSLVRRIKTGKFNDNYFLPTKKFNIEYVQEEKKGLLAFWDLPGQRNFRNKWLIGLQDSNIVIYMIDIANQLRFEESKKEFWRIINLYELEGVPLLILGNKIDLIQTSNEISHNQIQKLEEEIMNYFEFDRIRNKKWKFLFTSVKTNFNIKTAISVIFDLV